MAQIAAPAEGGTYHVGDTVTTTFSCTETQAGFSLTGCKDSNGTTSASGANGTLDTATPGHKRYVVTATSTSGKTDEATLDYTVTVPPPGGTPPDLTPTAAVVKGTLTARFRRIANRLHVRTFLLRGAAPGTRLIVRCIGPRCPKRAFVATVGATGKTSLTRALRALRLRPGQRLRAELRRTGETTHRLTWKMGKRGTPRPVAACITPGSRTVSTCPSRKGALAGR